ncbi:DUF3976 domain-containing protein [Bacillus toyonensis]|jgi:hypothetical protein
MQMMYAFGMGIVLFLAVFLFIRKDVQGGTLTKRGFYKMIGCLDSVYTRFNHREIAAKVTAPLKADVVFV